MAESQTWAEGPFGTGPLEFCLGLLSSFNAAGWDRSGPAAPSRPAVAAGSGAATVSSLENASEVVRGRIEGVRALAIVRLNGRIDGSVVLDHSLDPGLLAEFATLLRIAYRASQDAGSGNLIETTWSSEGGTVLTRRVDGHRFLMLMGGATLRTSLARYVLRQAARRMASS